MITEKSRLVMLKTNKYNIILIKNKTGDKENLLAILFFFLKSL